MLDFRALARVALVPPLAAALVACTSAPPRESDGEDGEIESATSALTTPCYGKALRVSHSSSVQPIGRSLMIHLDLHCEDGATPKPREVRFYVKADAGPKHL